MEKGTCCSFETISSGAKSIKIVSKIQMVDQSFLSFWFISTWIFTYKSVVKNLSKRLPFSRSLDERPDAASCREDGRVFFEWFLGDSGIFWWSLMWYQFHKGPSRRNEIHTWEILLHRRTFDQTWCSKNYQVPHVCDISVNQMNPAWGEKVYVTWQNTDYAKYIKVPLP